MSDKAKVSGSIVRAKLALEQALADLDRVPLADPGVSALMAHALNNFLSVSLATIDVLRETLTNPPEDEAWQLIDGLEHSARVMMGGVARLQGDTTEVRLLRVPVVMRRLLDRAVSYYGPEALGKGLMLTIDVEPGVTRAWGDGIAIGAVIDNLLSNAIKFSRPGDTVTLRLARDGDGVVCEVIDHGPGISEAEQAHLFVNSGARTARPTGGEPSHGHGLVVAATLMKRLGGTIGCRSAPGVGSTFWFRLPSAEAADGAVSPS